MGNWGKRGSGALALVKEERRDGRRGGEDRWSEGRDRKAGKEQKAGGERGRKSGVLKWTGERRLAVWF